MAINQVFLIGRLTKDVELKYSQSQTAYARVTVACDRGKNKDGQDQGCDFVPVTAFGRTAENMERYLSKGSQLAVIGRIRTGSYENSEGKKIYTTDVYADRIEFLDSKGGEVKSENSQNRNTKPDSTDIPSGFSQLNDDDIPF